MIVLMVYGHIDHVGSLAILQKQFVVLIYTFHVPIFLIISGFFFKITPQEEEYESGKRLLQRLIIPYLIFISHWSYINSEDGYSHFKPIPRIFSGFYSDRIP